MSKNNWLEYTDADYDALIDKWRYTWDVYTGEYSDLSKAKEYLRKRAFYEKDETFNLRISGVDPDLTLFTIISSIVGQAFSTEEDDKYVFEDAAFEDIFKNKLWSKFGVDEQGEVMSYPVFWKADASRQIVFQWMYLLVEGIQTVEEDGAERVSQEARVKLITPDMVLAKGDGWMKVKHSVMSGTEAVNDEQEKVDQYTVYHLDGWTRYQDVKGAAVEVESGEYAFYTDETQRQKRLPIFLIKLPFPVYIAHYLARKVVVLFNLNSCVDTFVMEGTKITLVDDADVATHEANKTDLHADESHINHDGKMYYIAAPEGPAKMGNEHIEIKRKELMRTALQQFGDAAKMSTATEIRYKSKSGIEAFLALFVTTIEEAEQEVLFLLEQVYFPNEPSRWKKAKVTRSKKFQVLDPTEMLKLILEIVFGANSIPLTDEMVINAVKTIWVDHLGYELPEEQVTDLEETVGIYLDGKLGSSRKFNIRNELEPEFEEL